MIAEESVAVTPFERTTCACETCVSCCRIQPASLHPGDFERIANHLGETREQAKAHFWASPGAVVMQRTDRGWVRFRIGTITPRMENGQCVFLDEQNRCRIHPVAPFGCAYFDTHMSREEGQIRGNWHLRAVIDDPEYAALRAELPNATSYKPRLA